MSAWGSWRLKASCHIRLIGLGGPRLWIGGPRLGRVQGKGALDLEVGRLIFSVQRRDFRLWRGMGLGHRFSGSRCVGIQCILEVKFEDLGLGSSSRVGRST